MNPEWFKRRGYKHFDVPVGIAFAKKACDPLFVAKHSWLPLIHYIKRVKRYKTDKGGKKKAKPGKTVFKDRPIMYASHRDACILAKYAFELSALLNKHYVAAGLASNVIAYRKLGKSNADFAAEVYQFVKDNAPCVVLCFDITGFFDHLDHAILKDRLKRILGVTDLPADWYKVFRFVTRFRNVELEDLEADSTFLANLESEASIPVATIAEVKAAGIVIHENGKRYGIPQGTPISSAFSNLYMLDVDDELAKLCTTLGALYRRYSDDILIACKPEHEVAISSALNAVVTRHRLEISAAKTERVVFDPAHPKSFQYLGFNISPDGAVIRPGSLARQWRKAKRSIRRTMKAAAAAIAAGTATKVFTKKLRRRFSPVGVKNFSSYARRSGKAFKSPKMAKQVRRLERYVDEKLKAARSGVPIIVSSPPKSPTGSDGGV
jgi:hypothetical protein